MKTILRKLMCPERARGLAYAMALTLLLSSMLAPLAPVMEASTASNYTDAVQRAASQELQPLQPLDPVDGGGDDSSADGTGDDSSADGMGDDSSADGMGDDSSADGMGDDSSADGTNGQNQTNLAEPVNPAVSVTVHWCTLAANVSGATDASMLKPDCGLNGLAQTVAITDVNTSSLVGSEYVSSFPYTSSYPGLQPGWLLDLNVTTLISVEEAMFCDVVSGTDAPAQYSKLNRGFYGTSGWGFDLVSGTTIVCDYFAKVPATTVLFLEKKICPERVDPATYAIDTLLQDCTVAPVEPVSFTVENTNSVPPYNESALTGTSEPYSAAFWYVPSGDVKVTEAVPEGYELLATTCEYVDLQDPTMQGTSQSVTQNDASSWFMNVPQAHLINCKVFNNPAADDTDVPAQLRVNMFWCPEETVFPNTDPAAEEDVAFNDAGVLRDACTLSGPPGTATLTSNTDPGIVMNGVASPDGKQHTFADIPADNWQLRLGLPPLDDESLYCIANSSQSNTKPYARVSFALLADPGYEMDIQNDETITCDFFAKLPSDDIVIEQGEPGDFELMKYICHSTPEADDSFDWYVNNCTETQNNVQFNLVGSVPDANLPNGHQANTGDNGTPGSITFAGVPAGTYTLTETPVDGYTSLAVFCATFDSAIRVQRGEILQETLTGNSIGVEIQTGLVTQCAWFNYAPENTSVTLYKWQCPEGTMYGQEESYYSAACDMEHIGVPFQMTDDNGTRDFNSDANGHQEDGLIGQILIREMGLDGYGDPVVYCYFDAENMGTLFTSANGEVTLPAANGGFWQCFWYNIPDNEIDLTIYKYKCPETVTNHLQDLTVYQTECTEEHVDIKFTVTDDNGPKTVWSNPGGVSVPNPTGMTSVTERIPTGYGLPAAFCQVSEAEGIVSQQLGGPFATIMPNGQEDVTCWFYNIPLQEHSLTLYKWMCPIGTMYGQPESYYSAECATQHADVPFQITDDNGTRDFVSEIDGHQEDGLVGELTLREMGLPGYGDPVVFCQLLNDEMATQYTSTGGVVVLPPAIGDDYQCFWYNIPEPESTVTIYKWRCPDGMPAEKTPMWFETNCTTPQDGVDFTLTDSKGPRLLTTTGGTVQWTDVAAGAVQVSETIPPGFDPHPYLVCVLSAPTGSVSLPYTPTTVNGTWNFTIEEPGSEITCDWYNWYLGNGEITVHKRLCPEGYDRTAWGADPMVDCTETINGINFRLDQPDPGVDLDSMTGDSIDSAVYFGGLVPGNYTLTEMVNMGDFKDIFVWQCVGLNSSAVHPVPLSVGTELNFIITGGDKIECYWFNVPYPEYGTMIVHKFNCSTETYVSDVYCYTNQTGQYFDLQMWNGSTWTTVQSGTTDVSGKVTFSNLDNGDYRLIEPDKKACLMKSSNITPNMNIGVNVGETTTVHVYNCKVLPPDPKKPGKYPNTGVAPSASETAPVSTPGIALAGLAGLMGIAMNRRRVVAGAGLVTAGAAATALPMLNAQELLPLDSTPAPGTPAPEDFFCATPSAATPGASTPVVDPCNRGPIPVHMRIPEIGVDAPIEYLEIIDGAMQQPTGDTHIAWYKETSRLGEIGNGIYAAHVNWYGNPEGIFFRLESLQEGDVIEVVGDDLQTHLFEVQWAQDFPSDEEPPEEALGLTDEVAITLITCGGEWSAALAEYDHRTLVRAVLRE